VAVLVSPVCVKCDWLEVPMQHVELQALDPSKRMCLCKA